jgi:hypothetical protein
LDALMEKLFLAPGVLVQVCGGKGCRQWLPAETAARWRIGLPIKNVKDLVVSQFCTSFYFFIMNSPGIYKYVSMWHKHNFVLFKNNIVLNLCVDGLLKISCMLKYVKVVKMHFVSLDQETAISNQRRKCHSRNMGKKINKHSKTLVSQHTLGLAKYVGR